MLIFCDGMQSDGSLVRHGFDSMFLLLFGRTSSWDLLDNPDKLYVVRVSMHSNYFTTALLYYVIFTFSFYLTFCLLLHCIVESMSWQLASRLTETAFHLGCGPRLFLKLAFVRRPRYLAKSLIGWTQKLRIRRGVN